MVSGKNNDVWKNFIDGDDEAFRILYSTYAEPLFSYGSIHTKDPELIKDCIHDLFVDLDRYRQKLNPFVNVRAYLLVSLRRKIHAKRNHGMQVDMTEDVINTAQLIREGNAEMRIIEEEQQAAIVRRLKLEIEKLPLRQREVLELRFNAEMEYEEMADVMGINIGTCRTLLYRAIKQLREKLEEQPLGSLLWLIFHR